MNGQGMDIARLRDEEIPALVARLSARLLARRWQMCTAESCTGGLIAAACTELAGSSDWFERGVVSYSNAAKPVGTVCFGWALPDRHWTTTCRFDGDRHAVRVQTVAHALQALEEALRGH
jgi:nicotinamide-nucleotide amidase